MAGPASRGAGGCWIAYALAFTDADERYRIEGDPALLLAVFGLLDELQFWFDIVPPDRRFAASLWRERDRPELPVS